MAVDFNQIRNFNFAEQFSKEDRSNLKTLWNRKKGELLYSTADGKLKSMWIWQRIAYSLSSSYRDAVQQGVKRAIQNLTDHIDGVSFKESEAKEGVALTKDTFITELFFKKLAPLSRHVFSRNLQESVIQVLTPKIQVAADEIGPNATEKYKQVYPIAKLWAKLGNIEPLGGASGSYKIIRGEVTQSNGQVIAKESLGIFKPFDEEPLAPSNNRTLQKIKKFFLKIPLSGPIRGSLLKTVAGQAYLAEATAKIVERHVVEAIKEFLAQPNANLDDRLKAGQEWLKLVTDTQVAHLDLRGKEEERAGSFQLWVQETHKEACQFLGMNEFYKKESGSFFGSTIASLIADIRGLQPSAADLKRVLPAELFDLLVIIDYAIGNGDRHGFNWFIVHDQNNQVNGIRLIDGGQAMAPEHPGYFSFMELHKRYLWRNLGLSKEGFTDLGKFVINKLHDHAFQQTLKGEIQALYNKHQPNDQNTTQNRLTRFSERLEVMHRYKDRTKVELGAVRTHRDFNRALA